MTPSPQPRSPHADHNGGGLFLGGIDPARIGTDGRTIALAVLVSLLFHAAIFAGIHRRPLGQINPALLAPRVEMVRIHRAAEDAVTDDGSTGPPTTPTNPNIQTTRPPTPAEAVRQTLTNNANLPPPALPSQAVPILRTPASGAPGSDAVEAGPRDPGRAGGLREPGEPGGAGDALANIGMAAGHGGRAGPNVALPPLLTKPPTLNQGVEIPYSGPVNGDPHLAVNGGALLPGPGHGKSVGGAGSGGSGLALDVLADKSTVPGATLGPPPLKPDNPVDSAGVPAPLVVPPPLAGADIQPPTAISPGRLDNPEHLDDDFEYILSVLDPTSDSSGYLRVDVHPKRTLHRLKTMPKDVVFLIDTSLSIPQEWATQVAEGVRDSLSSLNPGDRFNIALFNQAMVLFNPDGVVPATDANLAAANDFLDHVRAGGTTDINSAMGRQLVRDVAVERVYDIIFISDGKPTQGVQDMRELLNIVTRDNDLSASIYCVGVGDEPNHELLEFLAYRNKGFCIYPPSEKRSPAFIRDLMSRIRFPIIKNVHDTVAGIDDSQVFPRDLPDIHQGESFSIFGRWDKAGVFAMRLSGRNGAQPVDLTFTRDPAFGRRGEHHMIHDWAFAKLHFLYSEMLAKGETPEIRAAVEALRDEYGLKTVY